MSNLIKIVPLTLILINLIAMIIIKYFQIRVFIILFSLIVVTLIIYFKITIKKDDSVTSFDDIVINMAQFIIAIGIVVAITMKTLSIWFPEFD